MTEKHVADDWKIAIDALLIETKIFYVIAGFQIVQQLVMSIQELLLIHSKKHA